jgi:hypothetical protein
MESLRAGEVHSEMRVASSFCTPRAAPMKGELRAASASVVGQKETLPNGVTGPKRTMP